MGILLSRSGYLTPCPLEGVDFFLFLHILYVESIERCLFGRATGLVPEAAAVASVGAFHIVCPMRSAGRHFGGGLLFSEESDILISETAASPLRRVRVGVTAVASAESCTSPIAFAAVLLFSYDVMGGVPGFRLSLLTLGVDCGTCVSEESDSDERLV